MMTQEEAVRLKEAQARFNELNLNKSAQPQ